MRAKINYAAKGSGPAAVFLHGFLENKDMWDEFSDKLAESNKVIAIDLPGFGQSDVSTNDHNMIYMAKAVNAVLENENVSKCIMVGHSMGGYVVLAYADLFTDKLNGLVLFHSHAAADDDETKRNRNRTVKIVEKDHAKFISSFIPSLFSNTNVQKFKFEIDNIVDSSMKTKNEGIISALIAMRDRNDYRNLLTKLEIPVFTIVGKEDSRIPLEKIKDQVTLPKISEVLFLDNVGHMGFIEAKNLTYNAINGFLKRHNNR